MTFDQSKMGHVVAEHMEELENRFGEGCEIGDVCLIVEVTGPHGSTVLMRSSAANPHAAIGLMRTAEMLMLSNLGAQLEMREEDDEEEPE